MAEPQVEQAPAAVEHWEDHPDNVPLASLSLEEPADAGKSLPAASTETPLTTLNPFSQMPEAPILTALIDGKERATVLRVEEQVLQFIASDRDVLEFPGNFTNYQRMLAHKVAQYHGLLTSTVDYEGGVGRVVAHRRNVVTDKPKPRLSTLEITPAQVAAAATSQKGSPSERPKLLRRPSGHDSSRVAIDAMKNASTGPRTAKDREEEYNKARERIIGAVDAANGLGRGMGRAGMAAGRGMPGLPSPNNPGFAAANGRGRGRKGAFKDRALEDPDYVRGLNRFPMPPGAMYPDPSMYGMPPAMYGMHAPYNPELARTASGSSGPSPRAPAAPGATQPYTPAGPNAQAGQWAAPGSGNGKQQPYPPPPPPPGTSNGSKAGGSMPTTPIGSTTSSMHNQQPGQPGAAAGMRPYGMGAAMPYPGMQAYPMVGMSYPGMPQAMYPAGYAYAVPQGGYPYAMPPTMTAVPASGAADGSGMQAAQAQAAAQSGMAYAHPMAYAMPGGMAMGMQPMGSWPRMPVPMAAYPTMQMAGYPMQTGEMPAGSYPMYPMQGGMPQQCGQQQQQYYGGQQHSSGQHAGGSKRNNSHHSNHGNNYAGSSHSSNHQAAAAAPPPAATAAAAKDAPAAPAAAEAKEAA